jgi:hypothetical protein
MESKILDNVFNLIYEMSDHIKIKAKTQRFINNVGYAAKNPVKLAKAAAGQLNNTSVLQTIKDKYNANKHMTAENAKDIVINKAINTTKDFVTHLPEVGNAAAEAAAPINVIGIAKNAGKYVSDFNHRDNPDKKKDLTSPTVAVHRLTGSLPFGGLAMKGLNKVSNVISSLRKS